MGSRISKSGFIYVSFAAFVAMLSLPTLAATDAELLGFVKVGMEQRYNSIMSGNGSVHIRTSRFVDGRETTVERKTTVVFVGSRIRIIGEAILGPSVSYEGAFDGIKMTVWYKDSDFNFNPPARISNGLTGVLAGEFNVYVDPRSHGITRLADRPDAKITGAETLNGGDCVVVETELHAGDNVYMRTKLWVDTNRGFTIPKLEVSTISSTTGQVIGRREAVTELRQYGEDLWGPAKYTEIDYGADGTKTKQTILTYDPDFQLNIPVTEGELKLALPPGTEVYDEMLDELYTVP